MPGFARRHARLFGLLLVGTLGLYACGGSDDGSPAPPPPPASFTIGGTVSGLPSGAQVVLLNNGSDTLTVTVNGTFTFATALMSAAAYSVTVKTAPGGETCTVANGSGTVASAAITNVTVTCADSFTVGGLVSGLNSGQQVTLLDDGGGSLTVPANGAFSFATGLVSGAAFAVTVGTAPTGTTCAVSNGSGTVASANVTNVIVACAPTPIAGAKVLLELGHTQYIANLQGTVTRLLSEDQSGHWVLWNVAADALITSGNASCLSSRCGSSAQPLAAVALAGQTFVIENAGGLTIGAATGGQIVATIPGPISWWALASDGSYIATGSPTALQAWSPAGQRLFSLPGDYATAIAFAAPSQIQVANSPAGANVIQTIAAATGTATTGPAFQGTFNEWFVDGSHFQTVIRYTVYTYLNTSVQADLSSLPTVAGLGGQGNWFWSYNATYPGTVSVYAVGSSTAPAASYTGVIPQASGTTLAIETNADGPAQFTLVDLSGSTLTSSVQALPGFVGVAYAATSPTQWFIGSGFGTIFDGTSSVSAPKYLALGAAGSIAGGGGIAAIATASGQIFTINPQSGAIQNTIDAGAGQLEMSTDGTVLAALIGVLGNASPPSLNIYSLPSGTLSYSFGGSASSTTIYGYALAGSGTIIAQVTGPVGGSTGATLQQVTDLASSTVIWSSTTFVATPILFSPDGTLFAAPTEPYADGSGQAGVSANIYLNGVLSGAVQDAAVGWIDDSRLLVDNFSSPGYLNTYSGSTIYSPTGTALGSLALPATPSIQTVTANSVYSPQYNAIYSLTTGAAIWTGTPAPTQYSPVGAIAGAYAVVVFGTQVVAEPY